MNQLSKEKRKNIEIKTKKQILVVALGLILLTSNLPNFISVLWLNDSPIGIILKQGFNYITLPFVVFFWGEEFFKPNYIYDESKKLLHKHLSNFLVLVFCGLTLLLFGIHTALEINKALCFKDNKEVENLIKCISEKERDRYKPFF